MADYKRPSAPFWSNDSNPANSIRDEMWKFYWDGSQQANIPALKGYVYDLIKCATQKTAGQRGVNGHVDWDTLDMILWCIVLEATSLVLSGELDKLERRT